MILVDWEIKQAVKAGLIEISPFEPRLIQPNSIDIRLGSNFAWYTTTELIDVYDKNTINSHFVTMQSSNVDITPHEFILAETLEKITLPKNIVACIEGKSSLARLGLSLHQTGGWIDAGFSGTITLELYNANRRSIRLYSGMPIGQLVFYRTKECKRDYGEKPDAKYQNQKGATISKYENSLLTFNTKTQY